MLLRLINFIQVLRLAVIVDLSNRLNLLIIKTPAFMRGEYVIKHTTHIYI